MFVSFASQNLGTCSSKDNNEISCCISVTLMFWLWFDSYYKLPKPQPYLVQTSLK